MLVFTADDEYADSSDKHLVELTVRDEVKRVALPDINYEREHGYFLTLDLRDFEFTDKFDRCIRRGNIEGISLVESGNDGWLVESVVTLLEDEDGDTWLLSSDIGAHRWIDGDSLDERRRRFDLNIC